MIADASKTRLTVSLGLVIAVVCGAYYAGVDAGRGHGKAEALARDHEKTIAIETTLSKVTTLLETVVEQQREHSRSVKVLEEKTSALVADVQEIRATRATRK